MPEKTLPNLPASDCVLGAWSEGFIEDVKLDELVLNIVGWWLVRAAEQVFAMLAAITIPAIRRNRFFFMIFFLHKSLSRDFI
ncbi:MAG: hypothetical protein UW09_C0004G0092 [candidate division TM6 bacterium GW2011_GWF2_43_87]|nr:MAG: hypothetical protein UW09_C0004G0092 [candidate division TM6 bacterium GW2011_GWF2_43_87]